MIYRMNIIVDTRLSIDTWLIIHKSHGDLSRGRATCGLLQCERETCDARTRTYVQHHVQKYSRMISVMIFMLFTLDDTGTVEINSG